MEEHRMDNHCDTQWLLGCICIPGRDRGVAQYLNRCEHHWPHRLLHTRKDLGKVR